MDDLVKEWIKFSDMDFTTAQYLYDNMRPAPIEIICYHCQQSAEKALKAFLIHSKIKPEKTHDLESIRINCEEIDNSFNSIIKDCARLNRYGTQPRYPTEIEITDRDTLFALQDSKRINEFVACRL